MARWARRFLLAKPDVSWDDRSMGALCLVESLTNLMEVKMLANQLVSTSDGQREYRGVTVAPTDAKGFVLVKLLGKVHTGKNGRSHYRTRCRGQKWHIAQDVLVAA